MIRRLLKIIKMLFLLKFRMSCMAFGMDLKLRIPIVEFWLKLRVFRLVVVSVIIVIIMLNLVVFMKI
jgi:hypothetical protein